MVFSGENVYCRVCGAKMRVNGLNLSCDKCGNNGWLDEEDPEFPGVTMQRVVSTPSDDGDCINFGTWSNWDDDDD